MSNKSDAMNYDKRTIHKGKHKVRECLIKMSKCDNCEGSYRSGVMFQRHISKCHPDVENTHACSICIHKYSNIEDLLRHYVDHWSAGKECPLCKDSTVTFSRKARIQAHLLNNHNVDKDELASQRLASQKVYSRIERNKMYPCTYCQKLFEKPSQLERHTRIHSGERPFECEQCSMKFHQKNSLKLHILTHTNARPHKCHLCPDRFNQRGNLRLHLKRCHPIKPSQNRYYCQYCSCSFCNPIALNSHNIRIHQNLTEDKLIDKTVDEVMKSLACLNSQTQNEKDIIQKAIFCSGIDSNQEQNFNKTKPAQKKGHFNIKSFYCDLCNKKFRYPLGLSLHQYNIHNIREKNSPNKLEDQNHESIAIEKSNDTLPLSNTIEDFFSKDDSNINIDLSLLPLDDSSLYTANILNSSDLISPSTVETFQFTKDIQKEVIPFDANSLLNLDNQSTDAVSTFLDLNNEEMCIKNMLLDQSVNHFNPISNDTQICNDNMSFDSNSLLLNQLQANGVQISIAEDSQIFIHDKIPDTIDIGGNFSFDNGVNDILILGNEQTLTESIQQIPIITAADTNLKNDELNLFTLCDTMELNNLHDASDNITSIDNETLNEIGLDTPMEALPTKKHVCDKCPANFSKSSDLTRHYRTHTGERPYVCEECNKGFTTKSTYKRHLTVHLPSNKKPKVTCQVCGLPFSSKISLKLHMRIHTRENLFKCPLCSGSFRTSGHRSSHLKEHFKTNGRQSKKSKSELYTLTEDDIK